MEIKNQKILLLILLIASLATILVGYSFHRNKQNNNKALKTTRFRLNSVDNAEMVWVPAGEFLMGSSETDTLARYYEKPQHRVYLSGYWIYKYEVTIAQYKKYCLETGRRVPEAIRSKAGNYPVTNVTLYDAAGYAKWSGGSLPTEAQWEKAARGVDARIFPWGNSWDSSKCNGGDANGAKKVQPIGSYPTGASPYNCMDMAGNVSEWCADWYSEEYSFRSVSNPKGAKTGSHRILRGGGCYLTVHHFNRCAARRGDLPGNSSRNYGFRIVKQH